MKVCIIGAGACYTCDVDIATKVFQFIKDEQVDNEPLIDFIDGVISDFNSNLDTQESIEIIELDEAVRRNRDKEFLAVAVIGYNGSMSIQNCDIHNTSASLSNLINQLQIDIEALKEAKCYYDDAYIYTNDIDDPDIPYYINHFQPKDIIAFRDYPRDYG